MMKKLVIAVLAGSVLLVSGCASILTDDVQHINVMTSNGQKAQVMLDGQNFEVPGIMTVQKSKAQMKVISTSTEGCTPQTVLTRTIEPTFFINVLTGGVLGSTTDYSTEKMWRYDNSIMINCKS